MADSLAVAERLWGTVGSDAQRGIVVELDRVLVRSLADWRVAAEVASSLSTEVRTTERLIRPARIRRVYEHRLVAIAVVDGVPVERIARRWSYSL